MDYETVIGLEVHTQLQVNSKIFCSCSAEFGAEPNSHTCPGCQGLPGALPYLNEAVVDSALKLGLALGGRVNLVSTFERKHYFYPDLPAGYQITQNTQPIIVGGRVEIHTSAGPKTVRLHHIHLEEDAGKLVHDPGGDRSCIDLNRAGCGLLEIVSEPDLRSAEEAVAYLKALREILIYLGISDGNMEEGSLRCDVNISLKPQASETLGVRAEIKNVNSFKSVARAVAYEERRHQAALESGEPLKQQTRLFNETDGTTAAMRDKETSQDYRYFPDPNLPPVVIEEDRLARIKAGLPELAAAKKARYQAELGLPAQDVETLCQSPALAAFFEETLTSLAPQPTPKQAKTAANWLLSEFLRECAGLDLRKDQSPVSPGQVAELLAILEAGRLSGPLANEVFAKMCRSGRGAGEIMAAENLVVVTDDGALVPLIEEALAAAPDQVAQFLAGKEKVLGFFVGQVMKKSGGQADPKRVGELIRQKIQK